MPMYTRLFSKQSKFSPFGYYRFYKAAQTGT